MICGLYRSNPFQVHYCTNSKIRLFQLQSQFALHVSPLEFWPRHYHRNSYLNHIGASLSLINSTSLKISFSSSPCLTNRILGGNRPLCKIFPLPIFYKVLNTLTTHNLYFLEQLIST